MKIRHAIVEDAYGLAKVHVDAWRSTYRGIMPNSVLDELTYEKRSERHRENIGKQDPKHCWLVVESDWGEIVGFALSGPRREGNQSYDGEIYAIYLLKEFHGQGIGKSLFQQSVSWLRQNDYKAMLIWVLRDNPTRAFYEAMGGVELESKIIEIGAPLVEVSYGWSNLTGFKIS